MSEPFQPSLKPFSDSEPSPLSSPAPPLPVAGFWLRAAAFAVDIGLLSMVYALVGKNAYGALYPARGFTQILGALGVFLYFLIGNSSLTSGQTAGKALLNIRTISTDGGGLRWPTAAARAALVHLFVYGYLFAVFPIFSFVCTLFLGVRMPLTHLHFSFDTEIWLFMMTLGAVSAGFTFSGAVFCGLHPKKAGFQDLLTSTAVVRKGEESAALEFLSEWSEVDRTRQKLARWPAGTLVLVFLVLLVWGWTGLLPLHAEAQRPVLEARRSLESGSFQLMGVLGPSAEDAARFDQQLRAANTARAAENLDPITTESLRLARNGRKIYFFFMNDVSLTSESLAASADYAGIIRQLPALARDLHAEFFRDETGTAAPYTDIQVEFVEVLPLYLYSKNRQVWVDLISADLDTDNAEFKF